MFRYKFVDSLCTAFYFVKNLRSPRSSDVGRIQSTPAAPNSKRAPRIMTKQQQQQQIPTTGLMFCRLDRTESNSCIGRFIVTTRGLRGAAERTFVARVCAAAFSTSTSVVSFANNQSITDVKTFYVLIKVSKSTFLGFLPNVV